MGKVTPLPTVIDTSDFPGQFNFEILFENEKPRPAKCTPWTFSPSLGKLFAKMNSMVPIAVRLKGKWTGLLKLINYFEGYRFAIRIRWSTGAHVMVIKTLLLSLNKVSDLLHQMKFQFTFNQN